MNNVRTIELFCLKAAVLESVVADLNNENAISDAGVVDGNTNMSSPLIEQFDLDIRRNAHRMAEHYMVFYMLENDIRRLIGSTLKENYGENWWNDVVPESVKKEVNDNIVREEKAAITRRSDSMLDYTTFGQLGDIIRANWSDFAGMLSNEKALGRVLFQLNLSRGAIAHCGFLEADEVDRLYLAIKDWFRVLSGPNSKERWS